MANYTSELLQVADAVAREKNVPKESVVEAMEQAIEIAARKKYGYEHSIRAHIETGGGIKLFRELTVVEDSEATSEDFDSITQIILSDAQQRDAEIELGGIIREELPPIDLGRVAAQTAKQVIIQKVRDAERLRQYEEYKDRVGELVNGLVKRIDFGNVIIGLDQSTEAVIPRDQQIKGENYRVNDRVRALIFDVQQESKGHQIFLSRSAPKFMAKLFGQEVPEIYDGIIEIHSVARESGSRAKIAVLSHDSGIDPVGSCVGVRGARVQAVIAELQGEKIDIIQYSADHGTFIVKALAPAEVSKVVIDEENGRVEVVVPEDQLSLAIGRRGQNVRLASEITGWSIDVLTDEQESKRRTEEFNTASNLFIEALDVEDVIAHLLATEGFLTVEDVAYVSIEDVASIEGFDQEIAEELHNRANEHLEERAATEEKEWKDLGVSEDLKDLPHMTPKVMVTLGKKDVKSLDDFADLAREEFFELISDSGLSNDQIDEAIMKAREHWFADDNDDNADETVSDVKEDKASEDK